MTLRSRNVQNNASLSRTENKVLDASVVSRLSLSFSIVIKSECDLLPPESEGEATTLCRFLKLVHFRNMFSRCVAHDVVDVLWNKV